MTDDRYESAKFYDACDSETLSHETPWEAIAYVLDGHVERVGEPMSETIARIAPISVVAMNPETPDCEREAASNAEWLVERLLESWDEEYGGGDDPTATPEGWAKRVEAAVQAALVPFLKELPVWRCTPVGERTYSAEEILALVKENEPEWLDEAKNAD